MHSISQENDMLYETVTQKVKIGLLKWQSAMEVPRNMKILPEVKAKFYGCKTNNVVCE